MFLEGDVNRDVELPNLCDSPASRRVSMLVPVLACLLFFAGAVGVFFQADRNWDLLAYVGIVHEQRLESPEAIHQATYEALREASTEKQFTDLTSVENFYRREAFETPAVFVAQLDWYRVRAAYWGLASVLHGAGLPEVTAFRLINSLAYFGLCTVVFLFLSRTLADQRSALLGSALVALYPPLLDVARTLTPDILAAFAVITGFTAMLRGFLVPGALACLAAVFARTDAGILGLILIGPVLIVGNGSIARRLSAAAVLAMALPVVLSLNSVFDYPGWAKLFTDDFKGKLLYPNAVEVTVTAKDYIQGFARRISVVFLNTSIWLVGIMTLMALHKASLERKLTDPAVFWLGAVVVYIPVCIALFPYPVERFFAYVPVLVFLVLSLLYRSDIDTRIAS